MAQPKFKAAGEYAQIPLEQVFQQFKTSSAGISGQEATKRLAKFGQNTIQRGHRQSQFKLFIKNFTSLMAILLWVSGIIALFAGMLELAIAIWAVNLINGIFSFWQEHAAQKATDSLRQMLPAYTQVLRDGQQQRVDAADLVPGDIFTIQAGNSISADARLISATGLQVDESALTGESVPESKTVAYQPGDGKFAESNIVYAGTMAASGDAQAIALNTGMATEFGQIAQLTQNQKQNVSPLQKELNHLTQQISLLAILIGVLFFILAIFFVHYPIAKSFIFALGMIVAFIPEGLLPTVTLSLAQGVQRMAKKHALVKDLSSVETLGETTVICSDKTGTLTQNQMTVNHIWLPSGEYKVSGQGYVNNGQIQTDQQPYTFGHNHDLDLLLQISVLNNNTTVKAPQTADKQAKILGTPTEAALIILAEKAQLDLPSLQAKLPRQTEFPFDSERKRMTTIQNDHGQLTAYVKGALDGLLAISTLILDNGQVRPLTEQDRQTILAADKNYAAAGLRSLAVAYRQLPVQQAEWQQADVEQQLTFVGLTIMADPPRPEIYAAVAKCHAANIRIIMVTGDSALTAKSIACKIGITSDQARVVTGDELAAMSDAELKTALSGELIFARVAPEQKYRVVTMLQSMGEVVASTGDGVNDAPALKKADIGIAMGMTGTDVAKDAADMILTDDNFASIVAAIEEGRTVYSNIQKFLLYILNSNLPEAAPSVVFLFSRGLIPLPLTVMQILTVDLGTDMLPALGLGAERSEPGIMAQPPRAHNAHLLNRQLLWKAFGWYGLIAAILSTAGYFIANHVNGWTLATLANSGLDYRQATTMTLATIIFCQIAAALNCRTKRSSVFRIGLFSNRRIIGGIIFEVLLLLALMYQPELQLIFNTAPLRGSEWLYLLAIPIPLILIDEVRKYWSRRRVVTS
ncbi:cation-translocating P-type ATPase [Loigolactobacillus jiayinensis]|uniref:Cation-translocating P-type ATPase n=1 Tax=Loigolactobacillus jiayinensis TaxID=2486016 RepID=A0ABW1RG97_9LACO|nr:cation-transporting P-type ATPase [Loigolactobacillus jiayinensis]